MKKLILASLVAAFAAQAGIASAQIRDNTGSLSMTVTAPGEFVDYGSPARSGIRNGS
jgi:hypothetical protein